MANASFKKARKFKDQNGQYLWPSDSLAAGQPSTLIGAAVYEDPALSLGSATKSLLYGDLAAALIVKASPIRVAVSRDYAFNTDQIAIKTVHRLDGAVQDAAAAAYLVSANS